MFALRFMATNYILSRVQMVIHVWFFGWQWLCSEWFILYLDFKRYTRYTVKMTLEVQLKSLRIWLHMCRSFIPHSNTKPCFSHLVVILLTFLVW